jgi:alpha-glucosidase (family GH31 glycosyl hydrolase)
LGGILDFYVYAGPSPSDVVRQHTQLIGRPHMVPLWALGWHQSRYGYKNVDALHTVIKEYHKHKIPLEAIWVDIDYMQDHKDFTFDPENFPQERMAELADTLHARQQKLVMILDPGIKIEAGYGPYDSGLKRQVFLRTGDDTGYVVGKSWPGHVHFPDWFHPNTYDWWRLHLQQLINQVPVDGKLAIDIIRWISTNTLTITQASGSI